jgi:multidrug efflux pump subunit AcrA (membrane-fusion protein)
MKLHGKVSNVSQVAGQESPWQRSTEGASSFEITVLIEGTDPRIRPGMSAIVDLIIDEVPDSVYVPQESVFEEGDDTIVYIDTGRDYEKRPVELGTRNNNHVIVTAGLDGGERVCLRDPTLELERMGVPETEG